MWICPCNVSKVQVQLRIYVKSNVKALLALLAQPSLYLKNINRFWLNILLQAASKLLYNQAQKNLNLNNHQIISSKLVSHLKKKGLCRLVFHLHFNNYRRQFWKKWSKHLNLQFWWIKDNLKISKVKRDQSNFWSQIYSWN